MRVLLKISGEVLKGKKDFGIDTNFVLDIVSKIKEIKNNNIKLAIVIGGGNIYRGTDLIKSGVNATDSHNLCMLSTIFNGIILKNFLNKSGLDAVVMDPNGINFVEKYNKNIAIDYLNSGKIVICTGGTGNPYFTTDTGGVLRSIELDCKMMIKATKVDGIYNKDPINNNDAILYKKISYLNFIKEDLKIMDTSAVILAKENKHIIKVVNIFKEGSILKAIQGNTEGSCICL